MRPLFLKAISLAVTLAMASQAMAQDSPTPTPPAPVPAPTPETPPAPVAPPAPAASASQATVAAIAAAAAAAAARVDPAAKPFADIVKGAQHMGGFFSLYQRDEKVWIEIRPEQFDKPFFLSANVATGIGERSVYGSQMERSEVVAFRRLGNLVQLVALNTDFRAKAGTPLALAVSQGFTDSLLGSVPIVSAPHARTKGVLIEANALLFTDIPSFSTRLEYAFRMQYALDARNSSFASVRSDEGMTGFHVNAHYFVPRLAAAPMVPSLTAPYVPPPRHTPDPRSMFLGFYYSFAPLPEQPMHGRPADDRLGHFVTTAYDFTDDVRPTLTTHVVNRWRLEKKDPSLPLSEPRQPIVYWLDKNIPEKYRESVRQGVLAWNAAFERIGFKDAIVVKQQTAQDNFDTMDARHASVRWYVGADASMAIGPRQVDPRSGEILDADIAMSDIFARGARRMASEDSRWQAYGASQASNSAAVTAPGPHDESRCDFGMESAQEMGFAMELMEARGEFEMDSPKAEAVAQAYVRSVIMHEVGHTLGLRHNFRSSTIYSLFQLRDKDFTARNGLSGSVMDYTPFNIAIKGEQQGEYVMSTLGPYDYWAIEYAYKPIPEEQEKDELARIASRSNEPQFAFATDQEAYYGMSDPDVNLFDLGSDPLAYFQRRLAISRELWDRVQTRKLKPGESYESLRRSFIYGFDQFARTMPVVVKYVGGVTHLRDHAGTGRASFTPVPVERQRDALKLLTNNLFKADSFKFPPSLLSRLGGDQLEFRLRPDISINSAVLFLQAAAMDQLLSDAVAGRLLDSQEKVDDPKRALSLDELYTTLQAAVWSELKSGKDIGGMRRNLQREHLKRVAATLLRSTPGMRADARSLQRMHALELQRDIRGAMSGAIGTEAKAHLSECYETLSQALKAPMLRTGA
ncbi:zinc-dependent metalloprotease [Pseudoduganella namucuonensis]|uniref:DUF5117 domain-containing protein n=1 Tax=Pseudoduganella namucuonensis TaxID=1035707 RepID=A0A1I7JV37_9BURK|nr:zinc-dependent metalloprotease [Pseudoduganella namucuonensis]SFU89037.1 protein of unknown function [Pseudoduganella namucuonensis]